MNVAPPVRARARRLTPARPALALSAALALLAALASTSSAQNDVRFDVADGNWFSASSWKRGLDPAVPTASDSAQITNGGTARLSGGAATSQFLLIGGRDIPGDGPGRLRQTGGTLTVGQTVQLSNGIHTSDYSLDFGRLSAPAFLMGANPERSGVMGRATASVGTDADLFVGDLQIGFNAGSNATFTLLGSGGFVGADVVTVGNGNDTSGILFVLQERMRTEDLFVARRGSATGRAFVGVSATLEIGRTGRINYTLLPGQTDLRSGGSLENRGGRIVGLIDSATLFVSGTDARLFGLGTYDIRTTFESEIVPNTLNNVMSLTFARNSLVEVKEDGQFRRTPGLSFANSANLPGEGLDVEPEKVAVLSRVLLRSTQAAVGWGTGLAGSDVDYRLSDGTTTFAPPRLRIPYDFSELHPLDAQHNAIVVSRRLQVFQLGAYNRGDRSKPGGEIRNITATRPDGR